MGSEQRQGNPAEPTSMVAASGEENYNKPDIWKFLGIPKCVRDAVSIAGDAIGAVSTVVSWVQGVQKVLRALGLVDSAPNPFDTLYSKVQADLKVLLKATLAGATEERLRDVAEQSAAASTAAILANEYILLGRPQEPFHIDRLAQADRDSLNVMQVLKSDAWWRRSYDPSPAAVLGDAIRVQDHPFFQNLTWRGDVAPAAPSGGLIWDYRHVLPVYLQALAARIVVLKARASDHASFVSIATGEIQGYVAFLTHIHSTINGAIRLSDPLSPPPDPAKPYQPGTGYLRGVGAVEIFSGLHDWTWFDTDLQPVRPKTWSEAYHQYLAERTASRSRLYEALGLPQLVQIIDSLKALLVSNCGVATGANVTASAAAVECVNDHPAQHVAAIDGGQLNLLWKPDNATGWQWHRGGSPSWTVSSARPVLTWFGREGARRPHVFVTSRKFAGMESGGIPRYEGRLDSYAWDGAKWQWHNLGSGNKKPLANPVTTSFVHEGVPKMRVYTVADGVLFAACWTGTEWTWVNLGAPPGAGNLTGELTVVRYRYQGRMLDDLYAIAGDKLYEHTWYDDGRRSWGGQPSVQPSGVSLRGRPAAISYEADGKPIVVVFVTENEGRGLHSLEWDSGWRWTQHGSPPNTALRQGSGLAATTLRIPDRPQLVFAAAATVNNQIWVRVKSTTWGKWYHMSGGTPPAAATMLGVNAYLVDNGKRFSINVFASDGSGNVHTADYGKLGGTWTNLGR